VERNERENLSGLLHEVNSVFAKATELEGKLDNVCESNRKLLMLQTELHDMQIQVRDLKDDLMKTWALIDNKLDQGDMDG